MFRFVLISLLVLLSAACGQPTLSAGAAAYEEQILEWRADRLARLKAPDGDLNQVGLFWLKAGSHSIGSGPGCDVRLPRIAAPDVGILDVDAEGARMRVHPGVEVFSNGRAVSSLLIADDMTASPVELVHRSIAWAVISRDGRFAVRVRDLELPFVETFGPLPYFPIDGALRVPATLQRFDEPRIANVGTVIEGLGYHPKSTGIVQFTIDGQNYELEAYAADGRLFFVFGDATNRDETYGAGRFLHADLPGDDGLTVLDFNRAYSPPCAFNDFSTCPVASPQNRLPIRIEAGDKYDAALHYSAATGI